ncbi:HAMP domain-containing protein [Aliivibrio fischeri]|uniref:methyl-accepting chemotaxis protein n=1 Tax=Aliivibrio fischeri TaxID=668 RepID=UPI00135DD0FD|nr:HAMP domain-containing protein [Aliivibrio fischeri]
MTIKHKLYAIAMICILSTATLLGLTTYFANTAKDLHYVQLEVANFGQKLLTLRRHEKDFLNRNEASYLQKFIDTSNTAEHVEKELIPMIESYGLPRFEKLHESTEHYQEAFLELASAKKELGLTNNDNKLAAFDLSLQKMEPELSSTEKLDLEHWKQNVLNAKLDEIPVISSHSDQTELLASSIIDSLILIGISKNDGLLGQTRRAAHQTDNIYNKYKLGLQSSIEDKLEKLEIIKQTTTAAILLILLGFIGKLTHSINISIRTLINTMSHITDNRDVSKRCVITTKDELGQVATHFNQLLDSIEQLLQHSTHQSVQLAKNTENMNLEVSQVLDKYNVQSQLTEEMNTSIQEMSATISEIAKSTNVAAQGINTATGDAKKGQVVVNTTIEQINGLTDSLTKSHSSINALSDYIQKIGGTVTIIQGIAEQTNLLALNAAIEAARAGEQGRGFAVVADEVRALASRTHNSTVEITHIVNEIHEHMTKVTDNITDCKEQGENTLNSSDKLGQTLLAILTDMDDIQKNSEQVASAIEEQEVVVKLVSSSIGELNSLSMQNTSGTQRIQDEIESITVGAIQMKETMSEFTITKEHQ